GAVTDATAQSAPAQPIMVGAEQAEASAKSTLKGTEKDHAAVGSGAWWEQLGIEVRAAKPLPAGSKVVGTHDGTSHATPNAMKPEAQKHITDVSRAASAGSHREDKPETQDAASPHGVQDQNGAWDEQSKQQVMAAYHRVIEVVIE